MIREPKQARACADDDGGDTVEDHVFIGGPVGDVIKERGDGDGVGGCV
jgi:hypothetical protein